jgi:hypothetical protein
MMDTKQTITVGVANEGERNISVEELLKHEPKKITYSGRQVFFEHDGKFLSMDRMNFKEVYNK